MTVRQHTTFFRRGKPASAKLNYLAVMIAKLVSINLGEVDPLEML